MTNRLNTNEQRAIVITALRHALPYLRIFKNKVFVLKAGGDAFLTHESTRALREQILEALDLAHKDGAVGWLTELARTNKPAFVSLLGRVLPMQLPDEPISFQPAVIPIRFVSEPPRPDPALVEMDQREDEGGARGNCQADSRARFVTASREQPQAEAPPRPRVR